MRENMGRFEHGGDTYGREGVVDFSASINPLGMPQAAREAIVRHMEDYEAYPDFGCRDLRQALARTEGIHASKIICTAGASDLFQRICFALRPRTALVTAPCFSGYEQVLEQVSARIVRQRLLEEEDFDVTESLLGFSQRREIALDGESEGSADALAGVNGGGVGAAMCADGGAGVGASVNTGVRKPEDATPDMLFLCNPNNPTGRTIARDLLIRVLDEAREAGVIVVLDECFLDFTGEPSAVGLCFDYPNLIIVRAFTKMYAMAGLRVGYGICVDEGIIERLEQAGQPWAVSGPAQVAALAALEEEGWAQRTRNYITEQRELLERGLRECGMRVVPSQANYVMFQSRQPLYEPLLDCGFLIRRCGNFQELDDSWYRVAVRTAAENGALIEALQEVCKWQHVQ